MNKACGFIEKLLIFMMSTMKFMYISYVVCCRYDYLFIIDIPFDFSIIRMRLRKHTLKTEFFEQSADFSRFKLLKRQTSDALHVQHRSQNLLKDQEKYKQHLRFSSQFDYKGTVPKYSKQVVNAIKRLSWKRLKVPFQEKPKKISIRKSSDAVIQMDILKNHLRSIACKSTRGHKRTATEPCLSLKSSRCKKQRQEKQQMQPELFEKCCEIVDAIYNKVKLLKELGYADLKINEWVLNYCDNRRPYMKEIFMKNISKSLYTLQEEFEFEKNHKAIKEKLKYKIQKGRDIFYFIQEEELEEFCKYIEEILIQKNTQKAKEVQSSIIQKLSTQLVPRLKNKFSVFTKKEPAEVSNFICDLGQFQHKYGDFLALSKVNKLRFLELNRVQKSLKNVYQTVLQSETKKIVKDSPQATPPPLCSKQDSNGERL